MNHCDHSVRQNPSEHCVGDDTSARLVPNGAMRQFHGQSGTPASFHKHFISSIFLCGGNLSEGFRIAG